MSDRLEGGLFSCPFSFSSKFNQLGSIDGCRGVDMKRMDGSGSVLDVGGGNKVTVVNGLEGAIRYG